jgi:acyl carrier protein
VATKIKQRKKMNTKETIIKLADAFNCAENAVELESNLKSDLGYDSLDCIELIMAVEDKIDVEIPDEEAEKVKTVKDLVELVERLKK